MTQTNPEQWALDLLADIIDIGGLGGPCSEADCVECGKVALKIQAAFAEREARLVGALAKGGFMMTETHNIGEHRARKLVIGFQNGSDADLAMEAVAIAIKAYRDAT